MRAIKEEGIMAPLTHSPERKPTDTSSANTALQQTCLIANTYLSDRQLPDHLLRIVYYEQLAAKKEAQAA